MSLRDPSASPLQAHERQHVRWLAMEVSRLRVEKGAPAVGVGAETTEHDAAGCAVCAVVREFELSRPGRGE